MSWFWIKVRPRFFFFFYLRDVAWTVLVWKDLSSVPGRDGRSCTRGKVAAFTWETGLCCGLCGRKMELLKVPVEQRENCSQVEGNDCCKQRTSSCFVSWRCSISDLARFTDEPLFPQAEKSELACGRSSCFCNIYAIMWTENCMGVQHVHRTLKIPGVFVWFHGTGVLFHFGGTPLLSHTLHCCSRLIES